MGAGGEPVSISGMVSEGDQDYFFSICLVELYFLTLLRVQIIEEFSDI